MKYYISIFCVFLLIVCASVQIQPASTQSISSQEVKREPLANIDHIFTGMTRMEVQSILGKQLTIGYAQGQDTTQTFKPITVDAPYKTETFAGKTGSYEVLYYYTDVQKADDLISEDEMTPLVFEDDVLIGKGWDFLFRLKANL